jgi:hypothetical protein
MLSAMPTFKLLGAARLWSSGAPITYTGGQLSKHGISTISTIAV